MEGLNAALATIATTPAMFGRCCQMTLRHKDIHGRRLGSTGDFAIDFEMRIGRGSSAVTYAARDRATGEQVACKVTNPRRVGSDGAERERHILQMLNHRHVIAFKGHGRSSGSARHHLLFLEMASGGDLFDVVAKSNGKLSEDVLRRLFSQMIEAVAHCHSAGVAHRDLKLENFVLDAAGDVKLIDFDLAHVYGWQLKEGASVIDRSQPLREPCGTMGFAAPEVRTRAGYDGFAADLWSLGVCLFAMAMGCLPFNEATVVDPEFTAFTRAIASGCSPTEAALAGRRGPRRSLALRAILDGLLSVDPLKRLTISELQESAWLVSARPVPSPGHGAAVISSTRTSPH